MFKKLLVPLDRSPLAEQAIGTAATIAKASHADIDLILVDQTLSVGGFADAPWGGDQRDDNDEYLETIAKEVTSGASVSATHATLRGNPAEMICRRALDVNADLIVMTSHGRTGFSRAWLGSIADGVLRHSSVPVLMLRPVEGKSTRLGTPHPFKHVLVPLDGSAFATDALSTASALARCSGARLTLLRVVQPVPLIAPDAGMPLVYPPLVEDDTATKHLEHEAQDDLTELAHRFTKEAGVAIDSQVIVAGHVAQAIIDFAGGYDVDVIVMSTHGRGASRLFVGSVADKVLRASGLPILLRRPVGVAEMPLLTSAESIAKQLPALSGTWRIES